ncbi:hypothetical protein [Bacteroides oleiciplenus]|nr:hypothetical protein [Bacteroides oleiciplenus]
MTRRKRMIHCMHGFLLIGSLLLHSCSGETQLDGETGSPEGKDPSRQEVLLNINNKLVLHKTTTRDIATAEENAISTLDVYVFGSPTEDGTYTFQERFAYRENSDDLPADAKELILNAGATDNVTTGLLSLHRGLFVKLYCIANDTKPVKADGNDVVDNDFKPITFTAGGSIMEKAGSPSEVDFLKYHTQIMNGGMITDMLDTPLAMSGAQTLPLDLTDVSTGGRQQVNFKLTRLAARFDIVNKADESRFTIESISMGNARRGAGYFPIVACGAYPAIGGELTTTADKAFTGNNANTGTQQGAFYCYPSMQEDEGFLMLKGHYKVNETENKEVSYRIPFRQKGIDGQETYLDINNNHRYTIGITKADDLRLEFTLRVADWTDDGNIDDYEPDNKPGEITVSIPNDFQDRTTATLDPDRNVYTVSMSLDTGSSFDMTVGSSSPGIKIVYAGGPSAQKNNWLVCKPKSTTRISSSSDYTFSIKEDYTGLFPRATVRVYDVLSGIENILYVEAVAVPQPLATTQPGKAPNGTSTNPNSFDVANATVKLYRITNSSAKILFLCPDEMTVVKYPTWMNEPIASKNGAKTTYTLTLKERDVELSPDADMTVVFANSKNATKLRMPITIDLKDAAVTPLFSALGGSDNSYTLPTDGGTLGKISMSVANGNTCTVPVTSMDGVAVEFDFDGNSEWLTSEITAVDSKQQNVKFRLVNEKLAGAKDVTVTLVNKIGGPDVKFVISPNIGSLSFSGNSSWGVDVLNTTDKTITLYKVVGETQKMTIRVNSWGGSVLESSDTSIVKASGSTEQSVDAADYLLSATGTGTTQLTFANRVDPTKKETYTVTVKNFSAPTLNSYSGTLRSYSKNKSGTSVLSTTITVTPPVGGFEAFSANGNIANCSVSGTNCTVKAVKAGSTSITFRNKLDNTKTATYSVTVTGVLYEGQAVWEYYGYYIAPVDAGSGVPWDDSIVFDYYCRTKSGGNWYIPSAAEWRAILGGTSGNGTASSSVYNEYYGKVFNNAYYWSRDDSDSNNSYIMYITMKEGFVATNVNTYKGKVRCIAR